MPFLTLSNDPEKRQRQVEFGQAVDRETERVQNVQDLIAAIQTLRAQENTVVRRKPEKPPVDYFDSQQIDRQQAKQLRDLERDIAAANRKGAARPDGTLMGSMRTLGDAFSKDEEAKLMAKVGLGAAGLVGGLAAPLLVPTAPVLSAAAINALSGIPINLALDAPEGIGQDAIAGAAMGRAASAIHPAAALPAALASYAATNINDAEAGGFLRRLVDLPGPAVTARRYTPDERTSMLNELAPYARPRVLTPKASNILTSVLDDAVKQNETTVLYDRFNKPVSMYSMAGRGEPFDDSSYLSGLVSLNGPAGTGRQAAQHAARNSSLEGFRLFSTPTSQGFWDRIVESEPDWIKQYMPEHELEAYRYLPPVNFAGGGLASMAKNMARRSMSAIDEVGDYTTAPSGALSVVKTKGGNWLNGSVEDALRGLKKFPRQYSPEEWAKAEEILRKSAAGEIPGVDTAASTRNLNDFLGKRALDSFIDKQLTRYVKNEMATPEDPIRALAERGVLHFTPDTQRTAVAINAGPHPLGKSTKIAKEPLAKGWETLSDKGVSRRYADNFSDQARPEWLKSGVPVFNPSGGMADSLGFSHLIDELANAMNPESGLPRHLLLDPKSMDRVSVPQAVERVSQINAWRAAQKAEADALRANNAATVLHKEYPVSDYWHGGDYVPGSDLTRPLYVAKNKALAESYVGMSKDRTGKGSLVPLSHSAKSPAPEDVVVEEARKLGIDVDNYTPASIFDSELHGEGVVSALVRRLKAKGYDSANLHDIGYGTQVDDVATVLFPGVKTNKGYDNPKGLRWVELRQPDGLPEGYAVRQTESGVSELVSPKGEVMVAKSPEEAARMAWGDLRAQGGNPLADALRYEGDTMGHCVGGYCDEVIQGRSRIYSLRDAKGEPHVTIETSPGHPTITLREAIIKAQQDGVNVPADEDAMMEIANKYLIESSGPSRIVQIKGKQNRAPNEEYLPFVQDFVRSGKWSDVGDLQNSGLISRSRLNEGDVETLNKLGKQIPDYMTPAEYQALVESMGNNFAHGGSVDKNNLSVQQLQAIITQLRQEHLNAA